MYQFQFNKKQQQGIATRTPKKNEKQKKTTKVLINVAIKKQKGFQLYYIQFFCHDRSYFLYFISLCFIVLTLLGGEMSWLLLQVVSMLFLIFYKIIPL